MVNIKYNPALLQFQDSLTLLCADGIADPPVVNPTHQKRHVAAPGPPECPAAHGPTHFALESSEAHWILGFYQQSILGGSSHLVSGL